MQSIEISILKTITYFNVFSYPVTAEEIYFFLDRPVSNQELEDAISHLVTIKQIWQFENFYMLFNDPLLIQRRIEGNKLAQKLMKRAKRVAKFLSYFPFTRGIAVSGSLSKNFADENSDLDFFIIAKANRLWILRLFNSILCKAARFTGFSKWFCLNYIIDEVALTINEKNIFTAIEVSTLIPLRGLRAFEEFFEANTWVNEYLPNYKPNDASIKDLPHAVFKRVIESGMNFKFGDRLDDRLLCLFKKHFEKLLSKKIVLEKGFVVGSFEANKHIYKPMPEYFQPKILSKFEEQFLLVQEKYAACFAREDFV